MEMLPSSIFILLILPSICAVVVILPPRDGTIRLVNNNSNPEENNGNVEIFHASSWRQVCASDTTGWNMRSARVACRQLGFLHAVDASTSSSVLLASNSRANNAFWLTQFQCWGYERNLSSCASGDGVNNIMMIEECPSGRTARVKCSMVSRREQQRQQQQQQQQTARANASSTVLHAQLLGMQNDQPATEATTEAVAIASHQRDNSGVEHLQQQQFFPSVHLLLDSPHSSHHRGTARAVASSSNILTPRRRQQHTTTTKTTTPAPTTTTAKATTTEREAMTESLLLHVDPIRRRTQRQFTLPVEEVDSALQTTDDDNDQSLSSSQRLPESLRRILEGLISSAQISPALNPYTGEPQQQLLTPRIVSSSRQQRPDNGAIVNRYEIQLVPTSSTSAETTAAAQTLPVTLLRRAPPPSLPTPTVASPSRSSYNNYYDEPNYQQRVSSPSYSPQAEPSRSPPPPPTTPQQQQQHTYNFIPDPFAGVAEQPAPGRAVASSYSPQQPQHYQPHPLQRVPERVPQNFFNDMVAHASDGDIVLRNPSSSQQQVLHDESTSSSNGGMRKLRLLADNGRYSTVAGIVQYWDAGQQFWRVVCGTGWSMREAQVVCAHVQPGSAARAARPRPLHEIILAMESGKPLALSDTVKCSGSEQFLYQCRQDGTVCGGGGAFDSMTAASVECAGGDGDQPDLIPDGARLQSSLHVQKVPLYMLQCAMEEQCLASTANGPPPPGMSSYMWQYQTRTLLRFTLATKNVGTADFRPHILKNMWEWHACHQHYHSMEVFAHYDVIDQAGRKVAQGHKASFCLEDNECEHTWQRKYACANYGDQGISAGCVDTYKADIDCQWVDMTDVQPGIYVMRVAINPDRKVVESSFDNNVVECQLYYYEQTVMAQNCQTRALP